MPDHHIDHQTFSDKATRDSALASLVAQANVGDKIRLNDGQLIGHVVDAIGFDFDDQHRFGTFSEKEWEEILKDEPPLVAVNPHRPADCVDRATRCYGQRSLILPRGTIVRQIMIKAFGGPAWINIGAYDAVHLKENYLALEKARHKIE